MRDNLVGVAIAVVCLAMGMSAHAGGPPPGVQKFQSDQVVVIKARPVMPDVTSPAVGSSTTASTIPVRPPVFASRGRAPETGETRASMLTTGSITPPTTKAPVFQRNVQPPAPPVAAVEREKTATKRGVRSTVKRQRRSRRTVARRRSRRTVARRRSRSKDWMNEVLRQQF